MTDHSHRWHCISQCGACCRLCPEERQEALLALSEEDRATYLSMVGPDGWCIHYDSGGRRCRVYDHRPTFCRVSELGHLFSVEIDEIDAFATDCCRQQIRSTYGGKSLTLRRFNRAQRSATD